MTGKHEELLYCDDCPFLIITPKTTEGRADVHLGFSSWEVLQRNKCGVSTHYFGKINDFKKTAWELLEDGDNPKRKKGCLLLVEHIQAQMMEK